MICNGNFGPVRNKLPRKMAENAQDAYLANTKGFSNHGVGLVSGPKFFFGGGVKRASF